MQNSTLSFSQTMFLTLCQEEKKIYLWDEKVCTTVSIYEDPQVKVPFTSLCVAGKELFSDYIYCISENKSIITIFNTSNPEPLHKSSPLDEAITCTFITKSILAVGSIKGNVSIFDLTSGNSIVSIYASPNRISNLCLADDYSLIVLCKDSIKLYTFYDIMSNKNSMSVMEFSSMNNDGFSKILFLPVLRLIAFAGELNVRLYDFPGMKSNLGNIFLKEEVVDIKLCPLTLSNLYIALITKVYLVDTESLITENRGEIINESKLKQIIQVEHEITAFDIGSAAIAIGMINFEIHLFSLVDFKFISKYSQLKSIPILILAINRPISQYGLNHNGNLKTFEAKKLEKIHNSSNAQTVSVDLQYNKYIPNKLLSLLEEQIGL